MIFRSKTFWFAAAGTALFVLSLVIFREWVRNSVTTVEVYFTKDSQTKVDVAIKGCNPANDIEILSEFGRKPDQTPGIQYIRIRGSGQCDLNLGRSHPHIDHLVVDRFESRQRISRIGKINFGISNDYFWKCIFAIMFGVTSVLWGIECIFFQRNHRNTSSSRWMVQWGWPCFTFIGAPIVLAILKLGPEADGAAWSGFFAHFFDSLQRKQVPLWDPTVMGGTPFFPYIQAFGLFEPVALGIGIGRMLMGSWAPDLATSYLLVHWFRVGIFYLGVCGFFWTTATRYLNYSKHSQLALFATILFVSSSFKVMTHQNGGIHTYLYLPWIAMLVFDIFSNSDLAEQEKRWRVAVATLLIGFQTGIYLPGALLIVATVTMASFVAGRVHSRIQISRMECVVLGFSIVLMASPVVALYFSREELFPVLRTILNGVEMPSTPLAGASMSMIGSELVRRPFLGTAFDALSLFVGERGERFLHQRSEYSMFLSIFSVAWIWIAIRVFRQKGFRILLIINLVLWVVSGMTGLHTRYSQGIHRLIVECFPFLKAIEVFQNFVLGAHVLSAFLVMCGLLVCIEQPRLYRKQFWSIVCICLGFRMVFSNPDVSIRFFVVFGLMLAAISTISLSSKIFKLSGSLAKRDWFSPSAALVLAVALLDVLFVGSPMRLENLTTRLHKWATMESAKTHRSERILTEYQLDTRETPLARLATFGRQSTLLSVSHLKSWFENAPPTPYLYDSFFYSKYYFDIVHFVPPNFQKVIFRANHRFAPEMFESQNVIRLSDTESLKMLQNSQNPIDLCKTILVHHAPSVEQAYGEIVVPWKNRVGSAPFLSEKKPCGNTLEAKNAIKFSAVSDRSFELTLETSIEGDRWVYIPQVFSKYWRAYFDGKEVKVYRANIAMMAVEIPKGASKFYMEFRPNFIVISRWLWFVGIAIVVVYALHGFMRKRKIGTWA